MAEDASELLADESSEEVLQAVTAIVAAIDMEMTSARFMRARCLSFVDGRYRNFRYKYGLPYPAAT